MALPKKQLKEKLQEWGVSEENIQKAVEYILDGNSSSLDALREQMDEYKARADKADDLTRERDKYKADYEALQKTSGDAAKVQAEYDAYRQQVETDKANAGKKALIKKALEDAHANPAAIDLMLNTVKLDDVELDGEALKDAEAVLKPIREAHAGLFGTVQNQGTPPLNPPGGDGKMTRESFEKLPLSKRMEYINAHPEQQKELID